jgi:hypothetical protein
MEARFSRPTLPGAALVVEIWVDGETAYFRTYADGQLVLDYGRMIFSSTREQ